MILFVPETVARALARMRAALPDSSWEVERRGFWRRVERARVVLDGTPFELEPLSSGELSFELRARQDPSIDALAAFRVCGVGSATALTALTEASGGWLPEEDRSPMLRGLALCALVARLRAEDEEYEGRASEPARLFAWLSSHGAAIALSEEERGWLTAPVDRLPDEARYASLPERFASHAFALGLSAAPEPGSLHELMSRFGFLSDLLPPALAAAGIVRGRESFLG